MATDFKAVIEEYTGETVRQVLTCPDPFNGTIWAVRAEMDDGRWLEFLIEDTGAVADVVDEVEFKSWPPQLDKYHR